MTFTEAMDDVAKAFEVARRGGPRVGPVAVARCVRAGVAAHPPTPCRLSDLRETFGGVLLLGLEILVAADLVRTVAVEPTVESVAILGLIVLIRTFLSFSLEIEIEGVLPWRRALVSGGR